MGNLPHRQNTVRLRAFLKRHQRLSDFIPTAINSEGIKVISPTINDIHDAACRLQYCNQTGLRKTQKRS